MSAGVISSSSSRISPSSSASMSSSDHQKADQIAFHFYTKLFYVVNHARTTNQLPPKLDKWFNLETPDSDLFTREEREPYKSISQASPPPPLEIQVLLSIPELTHNQVLVHITPDSSRVRIHPTPRFVLLESFVLEFTPGRAPADVPLPTIYKHGIPLFRSLFTLLRILPAWKLHKRLRRRVGGGPSLGITVKVRTGSDPGILSMTNVDSKTYTFSPVPHPMGSLALSVTYLTSPTFQLDELESLLSSRFLSLDQRPFVPTLVKNHLRSSTSASPPRSPPRAIRPSYSSSSGASGTPLPLPGDRQSPAAPSSLPRSLLGSRISQHQPRHSIGGPPDTRLPPITTSSRTVSTSGFNLTGTSPSGLSSTRAQILRQEHQQEHLASSTSSSLSPSNSLYTSSPVINNPGQPQPAPRRPQYPFPFKSNTVSASAGSSPGTGAGTGAGVGLPSSLGSGSGIPSSLSERVALYDRERERVASLPHKPAAELALLSHSHSSSSTQSHSPALRAVPLPLVHQVSLSRRSSLRKSPDDPNVSASVSASASGSASGSAPRKRYSSSFGHRYAPSPVLGGSSGGSVGGVGPAQSSGSTTTTQHPPLSPSPSPSSPSFHRPPAAHHSPSSPSFPTQARPRTPIRTSTNTGVGGGGGGSGVRTEEDDISLFVQDIDMRKPLVGRARTPVDIGERKKQDETSTGTGTSTTEHPEARESRQEQQLSLPSGHPPQTPPRQPLSGQQPQHHLEPQSPPGGLILTSEAEVDARLRRMNETFLRSLEGLGNNNGGGSVRSRGRERGRVQQEAIRSNDSSATAAMAAADAAVTGSGSGSSNNEGAGAFSGARGRDKERGREGDVGQGWGIESPGYIRQTSEEIIGRMELDGEDDGEGEQYRA